MTLADLRSQLLAILNRNDCSTSLANTFINQAQTRIERTLRIPGMEKSSVVTGNEDPATDAIIIPVDFLQMKYLYTGCYLLENKDIGHFLRLPKNIGDPKYYCRIGASYMLKPAVSPGQEVYLVYYASQPSLVNDTDTNLFSTVASDLLLYAALSYATDYFVDDRVTAFEARFTALFGDLVEQANQTDMEQSAQQIAPAYNMEY